MMRGAMLMSTTIRRAAAVLLLLAPLLTAAQAGRAPAAGCAACAGSPCCRRPGVGDRAGGPCRMERDCCGGAAAPAATPLRNEALTSAREDLAAPGPTHGLAVMPIFRVRLLPPEPPEHPPRQTA